MEDFNSTPLSKEAKFPPIIVGGPSTRSPRSISPVAPFSRGNRESSDRDSPARKLFPGENPPAPRRIPAASSSPRGNRSFPSSLALASRGGAASSFASFPFPGDRASCLARIHHSRSGLRFRSSVQSGFCRRRNRRRLVGNFLGG
ncbi:hypothetical protein NL676_003414 [Syzygium grande]|nr:hypothetical protein NL676_003414 [Syzygium grande]